MKAFQKARRSQKNSVCWGSFLSQETLTFQGTPFPCSPNFFFSQGQSLCHFECQMSNDKYPMSNVKCPMCNAQCQISNFQCPMSNVKSQKGNVKYHMSKVKSLNLWRSQQIFGDLNRSLDISVYLQRSQQIFGYLWRYQQILLCYNQSVQIRLAHRLYTEVQYLFLEEKAHFMGNSLLCYRQIF